MSKLSTVVIVGRINVGKSTLFNRLSVDVKSLAFDQAGVTRDFLKDVVCWKDRCFELIDTGGVSLQKMDDIIAEEVRLRALQLIEVADLVLFVCDGKIGLLPQDRDIATMLHKLGKNVLLTVNKIDSMLAQEHFHEFQQLGFKSTVGISAQHGLGIGDLLDLLLNLLPVKKEVVEEEKPRYGVILLGKPNVGKSSLMNLLLKEERTIVTPIPGTTREPITERIAFYKEDIQVTDTPGIRRKRAIEEPLEKMMVRTAFRALERADIVLLLIDATEGQILDQELKLAFYAFEQQHKALILLFNKQDLVDEHMRERMEFSLEEYKYFMKKIVRLDISCKTEKNIGKIVPLVNKVWQRHSQELSEEEITILFKEALGKKPLFHKTSPLHIKRARQIKIAPITILLIVNEPKWFGPSQLGFFENILRRSYELQGVPVKFIPRKKG